MEIRNLQTKDIFKLISIVNKMNIKSEIKASALNQSKVKTQEELDALGFDLSFEIISRLDKAEKEIYSLLGSLTGQTIKEIESQDPLVTLDILKQVLEMEVFKNFFTSITK